MTHILSIGECMIEMAPTAQAATYAMGFAGDTMNTAWYLRHLLAEGDEVSYFTALGSDSASDQMVRFLDDAGIGTGHVVRRGDRTIGLYMIQLNDGERSFSYWRGQSAARQMADDPAALARALGGVGIAYFSGISIAILPPQGRETLFDALRTFRMAGGEVMFDPNLRPRLWESDTVMKDVVMQAAALSDTVLPSHEDEAEWFGDTNPEATAKRYVDQGAACVIVKNGDGPMMAWEDGNLSTHDPETVSQVVDTTAAGDSFNAGYIAGRVAGDDLAPAITKGAQLAAKVVQARGALVQI